LFNRGIKSHGTARGRGLEPVPDETDRLDMEISGKRILVVGLGTTGLATARFLHRRGASVTVTDSAREADLEAAVAEIRERGIGMELGGHDTGTFREAEMVILSPGVPHTLPPVAEARNRGVPVLGEIELSARFIREPIVAVTGTNGKTTATALLGRMLERSGLRTFVGGNIGDPLIGYVDRGERADRVVAEVSSFQLDTVIDFRPRVAVLLNIAEDHLDRYPDFAAYAGAKKRIFMNQQPGDTAVLNGADPAVMALAETIRSRKLVYGGKLDPVAPGREGAGITESEIIVALGECGRVTLPRREIALAGRHNAENAAAAALAALAAGGSIEGVRTALAEFAGLPHRTEPVGTVRGVRFVNDSKATNIDAVRRALEAFSDPVLLILGGRNKGADFRLLREPVRRRVKAAFAMGESRDEIRNVLADIAPLETVGSMDEAVNRAFQSARPGDVILLAPACASFDQYENYARRGDDFRRAVNMLSERLDES
jgi:UDP-N-acetylmuramoylalanine--D-glutamate ligase